MFSSSFDKTAGLPGVIGKGIGTAVHGVESGTQAVAKGLASRKKEFATGFRAGKMPNKAPSGTQLGAAKVKNISRAGGSPLSQEHANAITAKAPEDVKNRLNRLQAHKQQSKPSFVKKHPVVSGLAAYGAYKAVANGPKQETPPPAVYYPNQGY